MRVAGRCEMSVHVLFSTRAQFHCRHHNHGWRAYICTLPERLRRIQRLQPTARVVSKDQHPKHDHHHLGLSGASVKRPLVSSRSGHDLSNGICTIVQATEDLVHASPADIRRTAVSASFVQPKEQHFMLCLCHFERRDLAIMQRCIMTFSANDSQHVAPTLSLMQASETAVFRAQSDRVTTRIIDGDPHRFSNIGGERHANCRAPPDYHMLEGLYHTCRNRRIIFNVAALHTISFVLATEDETPKLEHVPTAHCHNDSSAVQWYCSPHLSSGIGLPRLTLPAVNHRCGTRVDASRLLHFLKVNRDFLTFAGSAASPSGLRQKQPLGFASTAATTASMLTPVSTSVCWVVSSDLLQSPRTGQYRRRLLATTRYVHAVQGSATNPP